jgi:biotin carboxylase
VPKKVLIANRGEIAIRASRTLVVPLGTSVEPGEFLVVLGPNRGLRG